MARDDFEDVLHHVYQAGIEPAQWPAALATVSDHLGVPGMLIANHNLELDEGMLIVSRLRPDISDLYVERYGKNPYSTEIKTRPPGRPVVGSELVDPAEIRRTAFFADVFAPQGIVEQVMIGHQGMIQGADTGGFAAMLDSRAADRVDEIVGRLYRLAPHLCAALDLSLAVQRTRADRQDVLLLLEAMPTPAMLLDRAGQVVHANGLAEALAAEPGGLGIVYGKRLTFSPAPENHVLRGLIGRAIAVADGTDRGTEPLVAKLRRGPGLPPLLASATPIPLTSRKSWPSARAGDTSILVRLMTPLSSVEARSEMIALLFDLTPREAMVATMITAGLTTPQIARELDLSTTTVRTYLSRCFDKTGVRSQAALAHLVASLPHTLGHSTPSKPHISALPTSIERQTSGRNRL